MSLKEYKKKRDFSKTSEPKGEKSVLEEIKKGSVKIVMHGKKLKGEFALVRMNSDKDENNWLLIKHNDDHAAKEEYNAENETSPSSKVSKKVEKKQNETKQKMNSFSKPMLASTASEPFDGDEWIFEIKWDGYRAIAEVGEQLRFYSRNGLSFKGKYPLIESALNKQKHNMILDGEIVAYNNKGMPDFQLLQHFEDNPDVTLIYHVFDLLFLNGHSTKELELMQRKELLKEALTETPNLKFNYHVENEGKAFYKSIEKSDLEGMMAKKKKSTYQEGVRSQAWLKVKNHKTDEAVIVGYTKPQGSGKKFGSLILGQYRDGKLHFSGHVGTGFSDKSLKEIYKLLQPLVTKQVPFDETPPVNAPPTWLKPNLVAVIKYSQMTKENVFRHPVFVGIREDSKNSSSTEDSSSDNKLKLTNLDKLYWKKEKITKGDLIDYYLSVSDYILPHLKDRAQSLHRFPDGIESPGFYHKDAGKGAPSWVKTVHIFSESNNKEIEYIICNDKDTLGYLINLGCIELNPWSNRVKFPDKPDFMIMDLDPSEKNSFEPKSGASVSMPVEWDEVTKDLTIQDFTIRNALDRIAKKGDIFSPVLGKGVDLIKALDSINRSKLS